MRPLSCFSPISIGILQWEASTHLQNVLSRRVVPPCSHHLSNLHLHSRASCSYSSCNIHLHDHSLSFHAPQVYLSKFQAKVPSQNPLHSPISREFPLLHRSMPRPLLDAPFHQTPSLYRLLHNCSWWTT